MKENKWVNEENGKNLLNKIEKIDYKVEKFEDKLDLKFEDLKSRVDENKRQLFSVDQKILCISKEPSDGQELDLKLKILEDKVDKKIKNLEVAIMERINENVREGFVKTWDKIKNIESILEELRSS